MIDQEPFPDLYLSTLIDYFEEELDFFNKIENVLIRYLGYLNFRLASHNLSLIQK